MSSFHSLSLWIGHNTYTMKYLSLFLSTLVVATSGQVDPPTTPKTTPIEYQDGDAQLLGHLAEPEADGALPAIVIIPYVYDRFYAVPLGTLCMH